MFLTAALVLASLLPGQPAAPKFEIADGDRIVWIGNTLVEREQRYGYWETALHAAFPDKQFTLRNLGWSGDTVFGDARGRFDFNNPDACFKQLVSLTLELKPTVIFVSYGTNESFEGEAGLPKFEKGLEKLLDALKPAKARMVLFTPMPVVESELPSGVDAKKRNSSLKAYSEAIGHIAKKRGDCFADLNLQFDAILGNLKAYRDDMKGASVVDIHLTDNGMHFTSDGYLVSEFAFLQSLGLKFDALHRKFDVNMAKLSGMPELRRAIIAKNELFFYRWRPQNETYLFGFRKHEQGKNAKEIVEFDPLIAKAEDDIEKLRKKLNK